MFDVLTVNKLLCVLFVDRLIMWCVIVYGPNVESVSSPNMSTSNSYTGAANAPRTVAFNSNLSSVSKTLDRSPKEKENRGKSTNESSRRSHEHERESRRERDPHTSMSANVSVIASVKGNKNGKFVIVVTIIDVIIHIRKTSMDSKVMAVIDTEGMIQVKRNTQGLQVRSGLR